MNQRNPLLPASGSTLYPLISQVFSHKIKTIFHTSKQKSNQMEMLTMNLHHSGVFHTRSLAEIPSRVRAEPLVWTSCSSDKKFQAWTENLSRTLFTLKAQLRLGSLFSEMSQHDFLPNSVITDTHYYLSTVEKIACVADTQAWIFHRYAT